MSAIAQGAGQPTDPQIAHIAYTAGQIDIKAAEQALGMSQNKDVKAFAEEMVKDHEAVNKKALALLDKLSVKPEDNDTSKSLADAASKKLEELSKLSGAAFDKAYAENDLVLPCQELSLGFMRSKSTIWRRRTRKYSRETPDQACPDPQGWQACWNSKPF